MSKHPGDIYHETIPSENKFRIFVHKLFRLPKPTAKQPYVVLNVDKFGGITYCEYGGKFINEWKANVSSHIDREVLDKL